MELKKSRNGFFFKDLLCGCFHAKYSVVLELVTSYLSSQSDVFSILLTDPRIVSLLCSKNSFEFVSFIIKTPDFYPKKKIMYVRILKFSKDVLWADKQILITRILKKLPNLSTLDLSGCVFRNTPFQIFKYLKTSAIQKLDIYNTTISPELKVSKQNSSFLDGLRNVEEFSFGGEYHSFHFFKVVSSFLKIMKNLKIVKIWNCDFASTTLDISANKNLGTIKFYCCHNIGISVLSNRQELSLRNLLFEDCQISLKFSNEIFAFLDYLGDIEINGISCSCGKITRDMEFVFKRNDNVNLKICGNCNKNLYVLCSECPVISDDFCPVCNVVDASKCKEVEECFHQLQIPNFLFNSTVHSNLVGFFMDNLKTEKIKICVSPNGSGIYLLFPDDCEESRNSLKSFMNIEVPDKFLERTLYSLCEPACLLTCVTLAKSLSLITEVQDSNCTKILDSSHKNLVDFFNSASPSEQLMKMIEPVKQGGLNNIPCAIGDLGGDGWTASKKLWTSKYVSEVAVTIDEIFDMISLDKENVMIGHEKFIGFEFVKKCRKFMENHDRSRVCGLFPMRIRNFLQDQKRYESHCIGILVFKDRVILVDPNGVPNEKFGDPNAVLLKLPWENKHKKKKK